MKASVVLKSIQYRKPLREDTFYFKEEFIGNYVDCSTLFRKHVYVFAQCDGVVNRSVFRTCPMGGESVLSPRHSYLTFLHLCYSSIMIE